MTRFLALIAVGAIAVALYATTAGGGQQAVTPGQFAALKRQVAQLQKNVAAITNQVQNCMVALGATEFNGYVYQQPDKSLILTTALDLAQQGETPDLFLLSAKAECVQGAHRSLMLGHVRVSHTKSR